MDTIDRILSLMEEKDVTAAKLTRDIGLTNGLIYQWKQRKQKPSAEKLAMLADYFKVDINYLLCKTDIKNKPAAESSELGELSEDEKELADIANKLTEEQLRELLDFARWKLKDQANDQHM